MAWAHGVHIASDSWTLQGTAQSGHLEPPGWKGHLANFSHISGSLSSPQPLKTDETGHCEWLPWATNSLGLSFLCGSTQGWDWGVPFRSSKIISDFLSNYCASSKYPVLFKASALEREDSFLPLPAQLCLTLCDPMDCTLPGSSVHGIFQARILE